MDRSDRLERFCWPDVVVWNSNGGVPVRQMKELSRRKKEKRIELFGKFENEAFLG